MFEQNKKIFGLVSIGLFGFGYGAIKIFRILQDTKRSNLEILEKILSNENKLQELLNVIKNTISSETLAKKSDKINESLNELIESSNSIKETSNLIKDSADKLGESNNKINKLLENIENLNLNIDELTKQFKNSYNESYLLVK